jgi:hypothetical protein
MERHLARKILLSPILTAILLLSITGSTFANPLPQEIIPNGDNPQIEIINPYYSIEYLTTADGIPLLREIINGPSNPIPEYQAEREASMTTIEPEGIIANFPSFDWVFGCSAVSSAMIAAYYDRGLYPNLYTGPTNGGVMPLTDTSWPTWSDGFETYPNNPLIASRNGLDGRTSKGSIDDYWIQYNSSTQDPYITGGWTQHGWGTAIGDYMKTSQSAYGNTDGSTTFYNWTSSTEKLTCADMVTNNIFQDDGTYGRKLFYEARGYTVTDCYNQKTDNNGGGFTLNNFKAEIDAGHPVLLNLAGHSIVGYGYNGSTIYIRDTWDSDPAHSYTMTWGGSYSGMSLQSVSVVHLSSLMLSNHMYLPLIQKPQQIVTNPILNPGFEQGHTSWTEYSALGWDVILEAVEAPITAHGGSWLAWLGGDDLETSRLSQTITISASAPFLHYWYYSASEDVCGYDFFRIKVNGTIVSTKDLCSSTNTNAWVAGVLNLSSYVGTGKTITFEVTTDSSYNSNMFLDDVSMSNAASAMAEEPDIAIIHGDSAALPK